MLDRLVVLLKFDLVSTIVERKSLNDSTVFFIDILNVPVTHLLKFRFNQWKITYDENPTQRFKIIKRHETELKWIKLLQTPFPLGGFNDNI